MRAQQWPLAAHQPAGHLVDGADGRDRHAAFDGLDNAVVVLGVDLVAALDQHDLRAHALGVGDDGSGAHAEGLGLVAGRDAAGGVGHHGHHAHRPAAQLGPRLLLHRGKVGVQIDEEPVERRARSGIRQPGIFCASGSCASSPPGSQIRQLLRPLLRNGRAGAGLELSSHSVFYFRLLFPMMPSELLNITTGIRSNDYSRKRT